MQGSEFFTDEDKVKVGHYNKDGTENVHLELTTPKACKMEWLDARDNAIINAVRLNNLGVTKQFINRLLEPFMWHTVICTATEWENFFALRAHEAAEIHMQKIAYMMLEEYNKSNPKVLKSGEWHIPFENEIENELIKISTKEDIADGTHQRIKIKTSTSMCARTSYTVVGDGKKEINFEKDIRIHDGLLSNGHMSPFEHCAKCMTNFEHQESEYSGNFLGFHQYRKTIQGEDRNDQRVIKK